MSVISTEGLTKIYGENTHPVVALQEVNLQVAQGEFVAIMGPSGSGKSTLLYLLGGLESPTRGKVWLNNTDLTTLNDDQLSRIRRTQLGFIFQFFNLIPVLSARDNVAMPLILDGASRAEALKKADTLLDSVGLDERKSHRPAELSGGQQQRVALARAMVSSPALILGDEPTGNLDSRSSDEVIQMLRRVVDTSGHTIMIVTHDPRVAAYTDRIIFLKDGRVVDENRLKGQPSTADSIREQLGRMSVG